MDKPPEKAAQQELIEQLSNALQELVDWQNGPPLIRDKDYWENAMKLSGIALATYREWEKDKE